MLMELTSPLKTGESVDIILETSVGEMMIEMPVQKIGNAKHGDDSAHVNATHEATHTAKKMQNDDHADIKNDEQASSN